VRDFCNTAFSLVGLDRQRHVTVDPMHFRPAEVESLVGDSSRAAQLLGWRPTITFSELVREMVEADLQLVANVPGPGLVRTKSPLCDPSSPLHRQSAAPVASTEQVPGSEAGSMIMQI
jgi:hypothetical protein